MFNNTKQQLVYNDYFLVFQNVIVIAVIASCC